MNAFPSYSDPGGLFCCLLVNIFLSSNQIVNKEKILNFRYSVLDAPGPPGRQRNLVASALVTCRIIFWLVVPVPVNCSLYPFFNGRGREPEVALCLRQIVYVRQRSAQRRRVAFQGLPDHFCRDERHRALMPSRLPERVGPPLDSHDFLHGDVISLIGGVGRFQCADEVCRAVGRIQRAERASMLRRDDHALPVQRSLRPPPHTGCRIVPTHHSGYSDDRVRDSTVLI